MNSIKKFLRKIADPRGSSRDDLPPVAAYFWDGGQPIAHSIQDISPTGFFLLTKERWPLGTLVMITLRRTKTEPDHPGSSIVVMSRAVRHDNDGVGFAFVPVETASPDQAPGPGTHPTDRKTLDRFLRRIASDRD